MKYSKLRLYLLSLSLGVNDQAGYLNVLSYVLLFKQYEIDKNI